MLIIVHLRREAGLYASPFSRAPALILGSIAVGVAARAPVLAFGMLRIPGVSPKAPLTLPKAVFATPSETLRTGLSQVCRIPN